MPTNYEQDLFRRLTSGQMESESRYLDHLSELPDTQTMSSLPVNGMPAESQPTSQLPNNQLSIDPRQLINQYAQSQQNLPMINNMPIQPAPVQQSQLMNSLLNMGQSQPNIQPQMPAESQSQTPPVQQFGELPPQLPLGLLSPDNNHTDGSLLNVLPLLNMSF